MRISAHFDYFKHFTFPSFGIIFISEVVKMENEKHSIDTSEIIEDLSLIKNPETYFKTIRNVLMCPGTGFAKVKKSEMY